MFDEREFLGITTFDRTTSHTDVVRNYNLIKLPPTIVNFSVPPSFMSCNFNNSITFNEAIFNENASDSKSITNYRILKAHFSLQQDTGEEQRFFRHEINAERISAVGSKKLFFSLYYKFSNYGFSIKYPLFKAILLPNLILSFFYHLLSAAEAPSIFKTFDFENTLNLQLLKFCLLNIFPLPGFDELLKDLRKDLFLTGTTQFLALVLEIAHKTLALIGYFLIGLALRKMFKMRS